MDTRKIEKDEGQLQIHFVTKQKQNAVADTPYSIPANISTDELIIMVNTILSSSNPDHTTIEFDFLIRGEFLRQNLKQFLREREVSFEDIIEIEYVERFPPPTPDNCLLHDDWVSAVQAQGKWILTGCYDSTLCIWNNKGEHKLTIPGHEAPVKDVVWISLDAKTGVFASASQDQTVMLWEWNITKNSVECIQVCKGHERGVDCVDVSTDKVRIASGSWDTMLKIWSAALYEADGSEAKRAKVSGSTRTPQMTLEGHREAISAVKWLDDHTILTASWDHTMKLWDLKLGGVKHEIVANKSFFDADYSMLNKLIVTASPDKNIRMYDPRSNQGTVVKNTYLGHSQWVQCVQWSKDDEYLFISGSYDNTVKLWDHRSPKAPLYDLTGHEDKILCCDWSNVKYMMSGGSDNSLRIFKSNKYVKESAEE